MWNFSAWEICLFSPIYLFIYLFNQTVIPITICSWISFYNQCNVVYIVAQIVSALAIRSSFSWLLCLFEILLSLRPTLFYFVLCPVFLTLQNLWHYKTIRAHLVLCLPQSQNQPDLGIEILKSNVSQEFSHLWSPFRLHCSSM